MTAKSDETIRSWVRARGTGAKVPGGGEISKETIRDAARRGECFVSNGAFLTASVDGVPMGSVCRTAEGKLHRLRIGAYPEPGGSFSRIEIVGKHGTVVAVKSDFGGGILEYEVPGSKDDSYLVVRAFGRGDRPDSAPDEVKHAAITNPVYLWPAGFQIQPARTRCALHVAEGSRWNGGTIEFQRRDGSLIERRRVAPGTIRIELPASARVALSNHGQKDRMFYIAMENRAAERNLSYLIHGEFRKDYPDLIRSQVSPEAFHLPQLREALQTFEYELK